MFCLSHLWTIWHIFLWDLQSIEIICIFFWTIWHTFLWDLQSIEIEVVLSPNYSTVSNNIYEEFIVNVVIRHYKYSYVKRHCKCNRVPGMARTLGLLIFYWVHSINMYSFGAWACIWCWTRLASFCAGPKRLVQYRHRKVRHHLWSSLFGYVYTYIECSRWELAS